MGFLDSVLGIGKVAAPFISGLLGYEGQNNTNSANQAMAKDQMDFQERMSSTAYQRAVKDLRAADLNPMLAYSNGPASSPGGSTAVMGNSMAAGLSSAYQTSQMQAVNAQVDKTEAETSNIKADTQIKLSQPDLVVAQTKAALASAGQLDALTDKTRQDMTKFEVEFKKLVSEYRQQRDREGITLMERQALERTFEQRVAAMAADAEKLVTLSKITGLQVPAAVNEAAFESSAVGQASRFTKYGLDVGKGVRDVVKPVPDVHIHKGK